MCLLKVFLAITFNKEKISEQCRWKSIERTRKHKKKITRLKNNNQKIEIESWEKATLRLEEVEEKHSKYLLKFNEKLIENYDLFSSRKEQNSSVELNKNKQVKIYFILY